MNPQTQANLPLPSPASLELFEHQKEAVDFMLAHRRVILADEMGVGKTLAAIHAAQGRTIIICPASLKRNWHAEILRAKPDVSVQVLDGRAPVKITGDWIIVNFEIAGAHAAKLIAAKPCTAIIDEAHELRNRKSKRFEAAGEIIYSCARRYLLTGTPVYNRPADILALLQLLGKLNVAFGGFYNFVERYCDAHEGEYGLDYSGASNLDELHAKLSAKNIMMRRKKADVLSLPEKRREVVRVAIDPKHTANYDECEKHLAAAIAKNPKLLKATEFKFLSRVRQATGVCKIEAAAAWIADFLAAPDNGKLIVFAHHVVVRRELARRFTSDAINMETATTRPARAKLVTEFQTGPQRIFLTSPRIGGTGLTLTSAATVLFVELDLTAAALLQAEDRAHRIGQSHAVRAVYLYADKTVDGFMLALINRKSKIFNEAIEGLDDGAYLLRLAARSCASGDCNRPLPPNPWKNNAFRVIPKLTPCRIAV